LDQCAERLRHDEILAIPTETVYGLAGNALKKSCAQAIFSVKGRPLIDPLIVHCASQEAAFNYLHPHPVIEAVAKRFWPGPLTIVATKRDVIPDIVTAGLDTVAIRVPQHPIFQQLLARLDFPLAAPSANPFGYVSPTQAQHVLKTLGNKITGILDGGPCTHGIESTILDLREPNNPAILRQGPITQSTIASALKGPLPDRSISLDANRPQRAPGQLLKHYSTQAAIELFVDHSPPRNASANSASKIATVLTQRPKAIHPTPDCYWLSESGNLEEVAHNLFSLMQKIDQSHYTDLHIQLAPNTGIGLAINDRLRRAAAK
jgi:L-threonylcarbamoyladenylate synthase